MTDYVVSIWDKNETRHRGTGIIIQPNIVLTCKHVIDGEYGTNIIEPKKCLIKKSVKTGSKHVIKTYYANAIKYCTASKEDMCLIFVNEEINSNGLPFLSNATEQWWKYFKDKILSGFPGYSAGVEVISQNFEETYTSYLEKSKEIIDIQAEGGAYEGFSGGALTVFYKNTRHGIAMAYRGGRDASKTRFIPARRIRSFLEQFNIEHKTFLEEFYKKPGAKIVLNLETLPPIRSGNPYKGLSYYDESDAELFFGREKLTKELCERFFQLQSENKTRFLILLGASGSGKSSAVRAGLLPALRKKFKEEKTRYEIIIIRPNKDPLYWLGFGIASVGKTIQFCNAEIASEAEKIKKTILNFEEHDGLVKSLSSPSGDYKCNIILFVDQFEEVFSSDVDEQNRLFFINSLNYAAQQSVCKISVIITLRSDFLGHAQEYETINKLTDINTKIIPVMNEVELICSIVEPAKSSGKTIEPSTVNYLIKNAKESKIALPLLQVALYEIWEKSGESDTISIPENLNIGTMLGDIAHKCLERLIEEDDKKIAKNIFLEMVDFGDNDKITRQRVYINKLVDEMKIEKTKIHEILKPFIAKDGQTEQQIRLINWETENDGREYVELVHEILIKEWDDLKQWIQENKADEIFKRRLDKQAELWASSGKPEGQLWRQPDLELMREYYEKNEKRFNKNEIRKEFYDVSNDLEKQEQDKKIKEQQQKEQLLKSEKQKKTTFLFASILVFVLLIIASFYGFIANKERVKSNELLVNRYWEYGLQSRKENNSLKSLHLMSFAISKTKDKQLSNLITQNLGEMCLQYILSDIKQVDTLHRGSPFFKHPEMLNNLITLFFDSSIVLLNLQTGKQLCFKNLKNMEGVEINVLFKSGTIFIESIGGRLSKDIPLTDNYYGHTLNEFTYVNISLYDLSSGNIISKIKPKGKIYEHLFSPDSTILVTLEDDSTVCLWDVKTGKNLYTIKYIQTIKTAILSNDLNQILIYGNDNKIRVYRLNSDICFTDIKQEDTLKHIYFSRDLKSIITWNIENLIKNIDIKTGKCNYILKHHGKINGLQFSSDSTKLLTWSDDSTLCLWDSKTYKKILRKKYNSAVKSAFFTNNPDIIFSLQSNYTIELFDFVKKLDIFKMPLNDKYTIHNLYFSYNNIIISQLCYNKFYYRVKNVYETDRRTDFKNYLFTRYILNCSSKNIFTRILKPYSEHIELLDGFNGNYITKMIHNSEIEGVCYSNDLSKILTWSNDNTARLWDIKTGEIIVELQQDDNIITAMISPNLKQIIVICENGTIRLYNLHKVNDKIIPNSDLKESNTGKLLYRDSTCILTRLSNDSVARLRAIETKRDIAIMQLNNKINNYCFSNESGKILTWSNDSTARLWNIKNGKEIDTFKHNENIDGALFSKDLTRIIIFHLNDSAYLWDITKKNSMKIASLPIGSEPPRFINSTRRILTLNNCNSFNFWDAVTGNLIAELPQKDMSATVLYSVNHMLILGHDSIATLWDASTGKLLSKLLLRKAVESAFSLKDSISIVTYDDNSHSLWNSFNGDIIEYKHVEYLSLLEIIRDKLSTGPIGDWYFITPDILFTVSFGQPQKLNLITDETIQFHHDRNIANTIISNDLKRLITLCDKYAYHGIKIKGMMEGDYSKAWLWDFETGNKIACISHFGGIKSGVFSKDSKKILSFGKDKSVRLWNSLNGEMYYSLKHEYDIDTAMFSYNEKLILSVSDKNTLYLWDVIRGCVIKKLLFSNDTIMDAFFYTDDTIFVKTKNNERFQLFDIQEDFDFPQNKFILQTEALTGTRYSVENNQITYLSPDEFDKVRNEWLNVAKKHAKKCKYPEANVYLKFYPEEKKN